MSTTRVLAIVGVSLALVVLTAATAAGFANEFREARRLKANLEHGRSLFAACATCHQPDGAGRAKDGIPNIAGQHYQFVLEQLVDFRETERVDLRMNAAAASHAIKGPQELADVAAYVADLPSMPTTDRGPGQFLIVGQNVYVRACSHCHGVTAEGNGELLYPRLAGQHYGYLKRQIEIILVGDRPNISWDHMKLLESLSPDEKTGIAGYLARLDGIRHAKATVTTSTSLVTARHAPKTPKA
jgi:cytochrome c553